MPKPHVRQSEMRYTAMKLQPHALTSVDGEAGRERGGSVGSTVGGAVTPTSYYILLHPARANSACLQLDERQREPHQVVAKF